MSNICCPYLHAKLFTRVQQYKLETASWTHTRSRIGSRLAGWPHPQVLSLLWDFRQFWISSCFLGPSQGPLRNPDKHLPRCSCTNSPAVRTWGTGSPAWLTQGIVLVTACSGLWPLEDKWKKLNPQIPSTFYLVIQHNSHKAASHISFSFHLDTNCYFETGN